MYNNFIMNNFETLFNSQEIKLKNQLPNKRLSVNVFRVLKSKFGESILCYNSKYKRVFFANSQLKGYLNTMKGDLKKDNSYFYKDDLLNSIIEFKIKFIKEDNDQVELEILKNKNTTGSTNETLPLSDYEN